MPRPIAATMETARPQWAWCRSWATLSSAVCQFHAHKPGNGNGKKKWPDNRLQIGEAPCERIDRDDVPITGGRQRAEAEIQHDGDFSRVSRRHGDVDEGARD